MTKKRMRHLKMKTIDGNKTLFKQLLKLSAPYKWFVLSGLIAVVALSGIDALFAYLIAPIINKGFVQRDSHFIHYLPLVVLLLFLLRGVFEYVSTYQLSKSTKYLLADMRKKVFHQMLHLPIDYYRAHSSGSMISLLIYNVDQLSNATTTTVLIAVREFALLVGLVFVMFFLNWQLSSLLFVILPLVAILFRVSSRKIRKIGHLTQALMGQVTQTAQEAIHNIEVLKLYTASQYEQKRFDASIDAAKSQDLKAVKTNSLSSGVIQILFSLVLATILYVAMLPSMHLTAGTFAAIIGALIQLLRPIRRLTSLNNSVQIGLAGAKSVFTFLDLPHEEDRGTLPKKNSEGLVAFQQVTFYYPNKDIPALDAVEFEAHQGTITALVGYSGGGKTTLINCISRLLLPQKGMITLDGKDIQAYKLDDLRSLIALVSQSPQLFNDSILNNIAYGQQVNEHSMKRVVQAAKDANIWEFIESLPQGLETKIGDHGVLLSGGQKQRLAIARAIYKNAPILILDEATSALDSHNEKIIQTALDRLMKGRTTFVIAHRLSTILHADQILVLDQGKIVERGKHQDLLDYNQLYARLYDIQFAQNVSKDS
jgi:subfamily B ATP-binding cassette protein MsbA